MTIYEYRCIKHGNFEVRLSMKEERKIACCPKCLAPAFRVFSPTPVHYATTGFYSIDSGKRYESQLTPKGKEIYEKAKLKAGV